MSNSDNASRSDETEDSEDPRLTELVAYLDGELDDSNSESKNPLTKLRISNLHVCQLRF